MANVQFPLDTSDLGFAAGSANREDFEDVIVNLSPIETPFYSTAPKVPISHTTHEWLETALQNAAGTGATEGAAFTADGTFGSASSRDRTSATTQIFRKDVEISNTQRAVRPAGVDDDYAYEIEVALKEIARNIEKRIFSNVTGTTTSARRTNSLNYWIKGTANPLVVNASAAAYSAVSGHSRATLEYLLEQLFVTGGAPDRVYMYPYSKTVYARELVGATASWATGGAGLNDRNIDANMHMLNANIDVFRSNFGTIQLVPDRFMVRASAADSTAVKAVGSDQAVTGEAMSPSAGNVGSIYAIETSKVAIGVLRPIQHFPLPPAGDSTRGMVLGELALIVKGSASAHGRIYNVINATGLNS